jgi:tRNA threonylcarbamoyladenosine biosynthesis protein TsaE
MNTDMTWQTHTTSSAETESLGVLLGANLRGGEVIELVSDLGGGKTTLTRGIVRGTGSRDRVASPTFTISREYQAPQFTIIHFDFYRLAEAGIVGDELSEFVGDPAYVVIVEWGEVVKDVLPQKRLAVTLAQTEDTGRDISFILPESLNYLMKELQV